MLFTRQTHSAIPGRISVLLKFISGPGPVPLAPRGRLWLLWALAKRVALGDPGPSKADLHEDTGDRCLGTGGK